MARTPIPFVSKFLCLHNYGIKYSTWDRYLHIIFAVIPPSWFIILLYIFFRLYSNKADFNTHALFIHSFIHSPSIYVSNSDFFLESQTRIHCCSRHFSTCMSRKHCSRAEAAAHCWPLRPRRCGTSSPQAPRPGLACDHFDNETWRNNVIYASAVPIWDPAFKRPGSFCCGLVEASHHFRSAAPLRQLPGQSRAHQPLTSAPLQLWEVPS